MNTIRNSVQLIGNLGRDPELRETGTGKKVASVSLATNEVYRKSDGTKSTLTSWHNLVAWGKTAEYMTQYLKKGKEVAISGKLAQRTYTDKQGVNRSITEVVVSEFVLLSKD